MIENLTTRFVEKLHELGESDVSEGIAHKAKRCLLDYLGATFAGARLLKEKNEQTLQLLGVKPDNDATLIGFGWKSGLADAVFVNGLSAHIAEFDDGVRFGAIHPGSPIFSALLAVAEKENVTSAKLISGVICGYEAAVRLATALQPSHYQSGYHPTGTCGAIGSAIGLSVMLGFSKEQTIDAFSAAAITASGMLKVIDGESELKPFNVGRAAQAGLYSARMARAGFHGPDDVLSGPTGFLSMMADSSDISHLTVNDGRLGIEKVYFKPYASCRHTHPAIEAVIKIKMDNGISIDDVKSVTVRTYKGVLGKHDNNEVRSSSSAKMSIPYCVAVSLAAGDAKLDHFEKDYLNDSKIIALTKEVVVCGDDQLSALVPVKRCAIVDIKTVQGRSYIERVDFPKGEPENPLSDLEIEEKFRHLAVYAGKSQEQCNEVVQLVRNLENELPSLLQLL